MGFNGIYELCEDALGKVGFSSVGSCRLFLSLFDRILAAFFSAVGVGFLARVFLRSVWGFSCGVVGVEVSASFQMGSCVGGDFRISSKVYVNQDS